MPWNSTKKNPRLASKEVNREISLRTGVPEEAINKIIKTFDDVIRESLLAGVEVPFGKLGYFSYINKPPRYNCPTINPRTGERLEPMDFPGCHTMRFRENNKWHNELKEKTKYWTDEYSADAVKEEKEDNDGV